jgi:hypothetical protein
MDSGAPANTTAVENFLDVETVDAGGGNYLVLCTERWAIDADGIDAFAKFLKAVVKKSEIKSR